MPECTQINGLIVHARDDINDVTTATSQLFKAAVKNGAQNVSIGVGRTQYSLYRRIVDDYGDLKEAARKIDYFQLDEYLGVSDRHHPQLLSNVIRNKLLGHIRHPSELHHMFNMNIDPDEAAAEMEQEVSRAGGLDLVITGIGDDGHIAWNKRGTPHNSRTHMEELSHGSLIQNAELWGSSDDVPRQGLTMGLGTIMEAKNFILMASGERKAQALYETFYGEISDRNPSTILRRMAAQGKQVIVVADYAALSKCDLHAF